MKSRIGLAFAAALLTATAGCGGTTTPPGEAVPALSTALTQVDAALADGDYAKARQSIDALIDETIAARNSGQLTTDQADQILAAAARLVADLPSESPAPQPTVTIEVPQNDDKGKDGDEKDDKGTDEGGGHNSGNKPDGGRGN